MNRLRVLLESWRLPLSFKVALKALLLIFVAVRAQGASPDSDVFFDVIQPLLKSKCVSCHGAEKQEANLRLDSLAAAKRGGDNGPALIPGDAKNSLLMRAIRHDDDVAEMPPNEQLSATIIDAVAEWIEGGASWPREVMVLFDDERLFVESLSQGDGSIRIESDDRSSGKISVAVGARERSAAQIGDWKFLIREHPQTGEYRFCLLYTSPSPRD